MVYDDKDSEDGQLTEFSSDQRELETIMSELMKMQQEFMGSMSTDPSNMDEEKLQELNSKVQSPHFQDIYKRLIKMQQKYVPQMAGASSDGDLGLLQSGMSEDLKQQLGAIRGKMRQMIDVINSLKDGHADIGGRVDTLEKEVASLKAIVTKMRG